MMSLEFNCIKHRTEVTVSLYNFVYTCALWRRNAYFRPNRKLCNLTLLSTFRAFKLFRISASSDTDTCRLDTPTKEKQK